MSAAIDEAAFRHALGHYPTGVCVVTGLDGDAMPVGLAVGSFTSVSLRPPLVGFFPDRSSSSWPRIRASGRFCVNILADHQRALCARFASRGGDKFLDLAHLPSPSGLPVLPGALLWIDCSLHSVTEAGDHDLVLGFVEGFEIQAAARPLLFFQGGFGHFVPEPD